MSHLISANVPTRPPLRPAKGHARNGGIRWRVALAALFALLGPGLPRIHSTTLARMDLRELAMRAAYVARVRCTNAVSSADAGHVSTSTTFEVTEAWKGSPPAEFTVRLPGGNAAGLRVMVEGAPRFAVGEQAVLFLANGKGGQISIVSWAQGTFRIRRDPRTGAEEVMQDTAGLQVLDPRTGQWSQGGQRRISLGQLRMRVAQAIAESAR
jgi:hypothetical protein